MSVIFTVFTKFLLNLYDRHTGDGKVNVVFCFAIVILGAFNNDKVSRKVDSPCKRTRRNQHL